MLNTEAESYETSGSFCACLPKNFNITQEIYPCIGTDDCDDEFNPCYYSYGCKPVDELSTAELASLFSRKMVRAYGLVCTGISQAWDGVIVGNEWVAVNNSAPSDWESGGFPVCLSKISFDYNQDDYDNGLQTKFCYKPAN